MTGMTPSGYRKSHKNLEIYIGGIRKPRRGRQAEATAEPAAGSLAEAADDRESSC